MFKHYFLLTFRILSRWKVSSIIAVMSLSLGIISSLLLYSFIDYHLSFEDFMPQGSNVKRLILKNDSDFYGYNGTMTLSMDETGLFRSEVTSIDEIAIRTIAADRLFHVDDELNREKFYAVSDNFFNMIPLPLIEGVRGDLFKEPDSIVLDRNFAEKYFPGEKALGREIIFHDDKSYTLKVSGVVDFPKNSHLRQDEPQVYYSEKFLTAFDEYSGIKRATVYFTPIENSDKTILHKEFDNFLKTILHVQDKSITELFYEEFGDIHLFSKANGSDVNNPLYMIIFLGTLTVALLAVSIINTISILTAQSICRTKEVGVRLVMGGRKNDLMIQFLTESITLSFISLVLALMVVELLHPAFSNLVGINLDYSYSAAFVLFIFLLALIVGFLSGIFPAFYLSSLKPVESLKGTKLIKLGKSKKGLLILQFLFASVILFWSLSINNEMKHMQKLDIGFNSENLISVYPGRWGFDEEDYAKMMELRDELLKIDGIEEITYTGWVPMLGGSYSENTYIGNDGVTTHQEYYSFIDKNYLNTLGINLLAGRVEENSVIAMKGVTRYRDLKIGDMIKLGSKNYRVSGIIDDYYLQSALDDYRSFFHIISEESFRYQIIRTGKKVNLKQIRKIWKSIFPHYYLIDFNNLKTVVHEENFPQTAQIVIKMINITMVLTLSISAFGLFGLTLQTVRQKIKEIGIRKVLGASLSNLIIKFIHESVSLIFIAVLIGIPLGVYSIKRGLFSMGYRVPVHDILPIALLSALLILLIDVLLVGLMVFRAVKSDPAKSLRYE